MALRYRLLDIVPTRRQLRSSTAPSAAIDLPPHRCKRCEHSWVSRVLAPVVCPRCKSPYWAQERKRPNQAVAPGHNGGGE